MRFMVSSERVRKMEKQTLQPLRARKSSIWLLSADISFMIILVTSALFATLSLGADFTYTKAMFVEGLSKGGFVLITLRDSNDNSEHRICALEAALLGAIHIQNHIDYDESGRKRVEDIETKH